eukprot:scaffold709_cov182-Skeletonema_marinoi.AAC.1
MMPSKSQVLLMLIFLIEAYRNIHMCGVAGNIKRSPSCVELAVFSHNAVGLHNAAIFFRHESPSRQVAGNKKRSPSCVDPTRWCRFINGFFETSESEEVYLSNSRDAIASMDKIAPMDTVWNGAVAMQLLADSINFSKKEE